MLMTQRSETQINWEASKLPDVEHSRINNKYTLESCTAVDTITDDMLETGADYEGLVVTCSSSSNDVVEDYRKQAEQAEPLYGANCALCEQHGANISLMMSSRYNLWCYSCNRSFFKGQDITDYNYWRYPGESVPSISPMAFDAAERAMVEAGVVEYSEIEQPEEPVDQTPEDLQTVNKEMTPTAAKTINFDAPEIKRLIYFRPSLALFTMVFVALCLPCLPWIFTKLS